MANQTLEQVIEEVGLAAKWETRGETRGEIRTRREERIRFARKLIEKGWSAEDIAETAELDLTAVADLCKEMR